MNPWFPPVHPHLAASPRAEGTVPLKGEVLPTDFNYLFMQLQSKGTEQRAKPTFIKANRPVFDVTLLRPQSSRFLQANSAPSGASSGHTKKDVFLQLFHKMRKNGGKNTTECTSKICFIHLLNFAHRRAEDTNSL